MEAGKGPSYTPVCLQLFNLCTMALVGHIGSNYDYWDVEAEKAHDFIRGQFTLREYGLLPISQIK